MKYLELKDNTHLDAIYMLGIAIHGIVDSFCPGHKGFQFYSLDNFSDHARQDKGIFSPNQVFNSIDITKQIYKELNRSDASDKTINTVITIWEKAYDRNLEETN